MPNQSKSRSREDSRESRESLAKSSRTVAPDLDLDLTTTLEKEGDLDQDQDHTQTTRACVRNGLTEGFKARGVLTPDTYFLPEATRLVTAYVEASGRLPADIVEAAFKAFDALAATWTVDRRTPKTFAGNWDAIQGVIGGQDPKPRQTQRHGPGGAQTVSAMPGAQSGRLRLAEDVLREKRTPVEERATEVPAELLELRRKLEIAG
jgi:hypothetical protein